VKAFAGLRWILVVVLLPLEVAGLFALVVWAYDLVRYDPAYFAGLYVERYTTPEVTARALERALQTGDQELLAELQGLRWPARFETASTMSFVMLRERTERYITYLYFDNLTLERYPHHLERVQGRWVVSPPDLCYHFHSGQWRHTFWPLAIAWWLLVAVSLPGVWLFRVRRKSAGLYDEE
jgi:hypothetical protein